MSDTASNDRREAEKVIEAAGALLSYIGVTTFDAARKEVAKLRLKERAHDGLPFCPDHRDKVAGKPCRECEVERLAALVGEPGEHSDLADHECSLCFRTPNDLQHGLPPRPGSTAAALPHSKGDSTP